MAAESEMRSGFTWVDVLLIVVILAIVGTIVAPQLASARTDPKVNMLRANLSSVRAALELYRIQHGNTYPPLRRLGEALTLASTPDGRTAPPETHGYGLGPYLRAIPTNPYANTNTVSPGDVGTSAWYYSDTTR